MICCSIPRADPIRAYKFFESCEHLEAKARLLPFVEPSANCGEFDLSAVDLDAFDEVVTHGAAGEYGHAHHISLHKHLADRCRGKLLVSCYGSAAGEKVIALSPDEEMRKLTALRAYDHVSPHDGKMKWLALVERYGQQFNLSVETYAHA